MSGRVGVAPMNHLAGNGPTRTRLRTVCVLEDSADVVSSADTPPVFTMRTWPVEVAVTYQNLSWPVEKPGGVRPGLTSESSTEKSHSTFAIPRLPGAVPLVLSQRLK